MARRLALAVLSLACLVALTAAPAPAAEDILKLVPDSALGFVAVNRLDNADAKLQQLGRQMQLPIPSSLGLLRDKGGIREGLDEKGTAGLLVLPPSGGTPWPTPVLLVPVTDYGKFLAQFKPEDAAAAVAKIEFKGKSFSARSIGGYAALTDMGHKDALTESLKLSEAIPEVLNPWGAWLAEEDAAVVIFQPGIKLLSASVQMGLTTMKATIAKAGDQGKQAMAGLDMYAKLFQAAEKEVASVGFGMRLDKQGVLHLTKRARLVPDGSWARLASLVKPAKENLLAGLPTGPFVVAGGGSLPEEIWDPLMQVSFDIMKSMPNVYGLNAEQVDQMPKTSLTAMKKVRGMSMVMGLGPAGTSLYSKMVIVMRVEKIDTFMDGYEDALKEYSEFVKKVNSPVLQPFEVEKTEIEGARALSMTMKAPKAPAGMETPQYDKMMEAMFGPGGKIDVWVVPADEHTVVIGYVTKEPLLQAIRAIKRGKPGLAGEAGVAKTVALLPAGAPWVGVWSPQGTIAFVKQVIPAVVPPGAKKPDIKIPEFPKTPPIGIAVTTAPNELQACMVVPVEVLQGIGQYAAKVKAIKEASEGKKTEEGNPVRGRVTLNGKPLRGAGRIRFVATEKADSKVMVIKDGKYEGRLKPGQYRVAIVTVSIPEKYRNPQTTGLVVEVAKDGPNVFDFDLKSD